MGAIYRHGDIFLVRIDTTTAVTGLEQARVNGRLILAEGEVTGHAHAISDEAATLVTAEEAEELRMWLMVEAPVRLTHEEHGTLTVEPGTYEVRRAREYTPESERWVAD